MRSLSTAFLIALCLSTFSPSTVRASDAGSKAPKAAKAKKPKSVKSSAQPTRAVSESTWSAMVDRQIIVVSNGHEIRGRLAGHDANNVTLIESNGAISDLPKDSISEVRADVRPAREEPEEKVPRRESETARARAAASEDAELGPAGSFRRRGKFLLVSPGLIALPFASPDLVFYRWGLSVGGMLPGESSSFAGAYGFTFEHFVDKDTVTESYYDPYYGTFDTLTADVWSHMLRALAEFRLGRSNQRIFGYALLGVGAAMLRVTASSGGIKATSNAFGFSAPLGGGIQGLIGERFILGFEPRVVLDFFVGDGIAAMFDTRVVLGAKF